MQDVNVYHVWLLAMTSVSVKKLYIYVRVFLQGYFIQDLQSENQPSTPTLTPHPSLEKSVQENAKLRVLLSMREHPKEAGQYAIDPSQSIPSGRCTFVIFCCFDVFWHGGASTVLDTGNERFKTIWITCVVVRTFRWLKPNLYLWTWARGCLSQLKVPRP